MKLGLVLTHHDVYMKIVPTTDINMTAALAIGVFMLMIGYSIKIKGVTGFIKELTLHPFHAANPFVQALLVPFNLLFRIDRISCQAVLTGTASVR